MQAPTVGGWQALKRIGRFLIGAPRLVVEDKRQAERRAVEVHTDSNFAGCLLTRKIASSCCVLIWSHWIRSSSITQGFQALSTGEAEFHVLVKGGSIALGLRTLGEDMGVKFEVILKCDATAGKGIAERRGVGKVRHFHTPLLWLQRVVQQTLIKVAKIAGADNVSDIGTKYVDGTLLRRHLAAMGFVVRQGRSKWALRAALDSG